MATLFGVTKDSVLLLKSKQENIVQKLNILMTFSLKPLHCLQSQNAVTSFLKSKYMPCFARHSGSCYIKARQNRYIGSTLPVYITTGL